MEGSKERHYSSKKVCGASSHDAPLQLLAAVACCLSTPPPSSVSSRSSSSGSSALPPRSPACTVSTYLCAWPPILGFLQPPWAVVNHCAQILTLEIALNGDKLILQGPCLKTAADDRSSGPSPNKRSSASLIYNFRPTLQTNLPDQPSRPTLQPPSTSRHSSFLLPPPPPPPPPPSSSSSFFSSSSSSPCFTASSESSSTFHRKSIHNNQMRATCPNCGYEVSSQVPVCQKCGNYCGRKMASAIRSASKVCVVSLRFVYPHIF